MDVAACDGPLEVKTENYTHTTQPQPKKDCLLQTLPDCLASGCLNCISAGDQYSYIAGLQ